MYLQDCRCFFVSLQRPKMCMYCRYILTPDLCIFFSQLPKLSSASASTGKCKSQEEYPQPHSICLPSFLSIPPPSAPEITPSPRLRRRIPRSSITPNLIVTMSGYVYRPETEQNSSSSPHGIREHRRYVHRYVDLRRSGAGPD
jgi:hypothetical protein